jgi:hypothetical protein
MSTIENNNEYHLSLFQSWLKYLNAAVLMRSLLLALIIGSVLTLLNQSDALFSDTAFEWFRLVSVFVTPFMVIAISQLVATQQAVSDIARSQTAAVKTHFVATMFSHNIPFRALMTSLIIGGANSLIILITAFLQTGDISNVPLTVLVQFYVLPFVFGALSQALTYRRTVAESVV